MSKVAGACKNSTNSYTETIKPEIFFGGKKNAKIMKRSHVYKSYVSTYNIQIRSSSDLEQQLKDTNSAIRSKLKDLLNELTGFKFVKTLLYAKKCSTFFSNSKAETIINENYINDLFRSVYGKIILNIQKSLRRDLS